MATSSEWTVTALLTSDCRVSAGRDGEPGVRCGVMQQRHEVAVFLAAGGQNRPPLKPAAREQTVTTNRSHARSASLMACDDKHKGTP